MVLTLTFAPLATLKSLKDSIVSAAHNAATFIGDKWLDAVVSINSIERGDIDTAINESPYIESSFKRSLLKSISDATNFMLDIESYGAETCIDKNIFFAESKPIHSTSLKKCFQNCNLLMAACLVGDNVNTEGYGTGNVVDFSYIFDGCILLCEVDTNKWDTSSARTMSYAFQACKNLKHIDVGGWSLLSVTALNYIFSGCSSLTTLDVSNWNVSNATNLAYAFSGCSSLTTLDVSNWNVSNATKIDHMFVNCKSLTSIDVSDWNVSKIETMSGLFDGCMALQSINLSGWVCSISGLVNTFNNCSSLSGTIDLSGVDMTSCVSINSAFHGCSLLASIVGLNLSGINLNINTYTATQYNNQVVYSSSNLTSLTSCELEGTLYRGISLSRMPNLDSASILSWLSALYDWRTNEESKTSYEVTVTNGTFVSGPTLTMPQRYVTTIANTEDADIIETFIALVVQATEEEEGYGWTITGIDIEPLLGE